MKVYIFKLKREPNQIYAFTCNKKAALQFEEERDITRFIVEEIKLSDNQFAIFANKHRRALLHEEILYDGKNTFTIMATIDESSTVDGYCDYIHKIIETVDRELVLFPFKDEYLKTIKEITLNIKMTDKKSSPTLLLNVDTFKLFYKLNAYTFGGESEEIIIKGDYANG